MTIPYQPTAPMRELRVGKALVVGNDSFATVCQTQLIRAAIETFDNDKPYEGHDSAFERAKQWAETNRNDPRLKSIFDVFGG